MFNASTSPLLWVLGYNSGGTSTGGSGEGTPITIEFKNDTPAVAHLDYSSPELTPAPSPDEGGNVPYLSSTTFSGSAENAVSLQLAQYGVESFLTNAPKCYYDFSISNGKWSANPDASNVDCIVTSTGDNTFTMTMSWPAAETVDYTALRANVSTILKGYLNSKGNTTALIANQVPLSEEQQANFVTAATDNVANGWTLQFGYDVIRLPLWLGAYYQQNAGKGGSQAHFADLYNYLVSTSQFVAANTCTTSNGSVSVNSSGFWAFPVAGVAKDGDAVAPANCENTPALEGPLAVAAKATGDTETANALINTLSQYDLSKKTFSAYEQEHGSQLTQAEFTSSSSPYFNSTLALISQALLIGNGSLNISAANDNNSQAYLTYANFKSNYQAWLNSGFLAAFDAPNPADKSKTDASLRVVYSTYNALNYSANNPAGTLGNAPTVSEGMAYGLLIAYAANDQQTFDKLLTYVISEAHYQGCAQMNEAQTECSVKSQYLMPWMIDESGKPFNYTVAGSYFTSGSAYDADLQIIWALDLAQKRVNEGKWTATKFDGKTYAQLATAMIDEVNRYVTARGVTYFGTELAGGGVFFTPGSQWGAPLEPSEVLGCQGNNICGTNLIYPGYITPAAFDVMEALQVAAQ